MSKPAASKEKIDPPTGVEVVNQAIDYGPLPNLVGYRIKRAHAYSVHTFTNIFEEVGLAYGQYSVLLLIGLNPGLSQLALADAAGLNGSTIVPITNRFVKQGWIRRLNRKDDRRHYSLRVTAQGQAVLDRARTLLKAHEDDLNSALTREERSALLHLLSKITDRKDADSIAFSRRSDGARTSTEMASK